MVKQHTTIKDLLDDFRSLNMSASQSTFIERCRYPRARLEEIISRQLAFYLNPYEEHELGSIVIDALIEALGEKSLTFTGNIKIDLEVEHKNKRIDILITDNKTVIAIENKLLSSADNPFDIYNDKIESLQHLNKYRVLLTLKEISNKEFKRHKFKQVLYSELFSMLTPKLEQIEKNRHYYFLIDMMDTLNNMSNDKKIDGNLLKFMISNKSDIDDLIQTYGIYNEHLHMNNYKKLENVYDFIKDKTGDERWWIYHEISLGLGKFERDGSNYGLELSFGSSNITRITVSIWNDEDYSNLKEHFKTVREFKNKDFYRKKHMHYLTFYESHNYDNEEVCKKMLELYNILKKQESSNKALEGTF